MSEGKLIRRQEQNYRQATCFMLLTYQEPAKLFNMQQWIGNLPESNLIDLNKLSTGNIQYLLQNSIKSSVLDKCPRCYAITSLLGLLTPLLVHDCSINMGGSSSSSTLDHRLDSGTPRGLHGFTLHPPHFQNTACGFCVCTKSTYADPATSTCHSHFHSTILMHAVQMHLEKVRGEVSRGVKQGPRRMPTLSQRARVKPAAGQPGVAIKGVAYCVQKVNKGSAYTADPRL